MIEQIRIIVCDDHHVIRSGIISTLKLDPSLSVIGEAANGLEAVEKYIKLKPDVIVMDLSMPECYEMDGPAAIAAIRSFDPSCKVLIMTGLDIIGPLKQGLRAGARGLVLKDVSRHELHAAVRAVFNDQRYIPSHLSDILQEAGNKNIDALTDRELQVLRLVSRSSENAEIAQELDIAISTVSSHLRTIYAKLGVSDRTQAALLAMRNGYI
ncbi:MAG: response regulator transcription factor [Gemmatimonadaceae bacterium]|nr:response regulator transcription factor [Gloeobacterales cyanobacterium ES-bin-141]